MLKENKLLSIISILKEVEPMSDYRNESIRSKMDEMRMYTAIVIFFLLNVFLGVIGTFWLRTQQKRSEIGLRMVLGATRSSIFRWLLSQGILLLLVSFFVGILIFGNIWIADILHPVEWVGSTQRLLTGGGITFLLLAGMICVGISFPAYRAMKDEPAEALHYE